MALGPPEGTLYRLDHAALAVKAIICGGRNYEFTGKDYADLDKLHELIGITEVVSGKQRGADTCGEKWAMAHHISVKGFPITRADWKQYGMGAGPIRNRRMRDYILPDGVCIAFPGHNGTANMVSLAKERDIHVFDWRGKWQVKRPPVP